MRIILSLAIGFIFQIGFSQVSIGLIGEPTLNLVRIGDTPRKASDSLSGLLTNDKTLSLGLEVRKQIDRYQSITFIPGYYQSNMLLVKEKLNFLDIIHPELPEIRDLAQAAEKIAYLHYRQKYIGTQIIYAKKLKARPSNTKLSFEVGGGIGAYYLFSDDIKIRTEGFAVNGEYIHIISDNTGIETHDVLVNVLLLGDLNYSISPRLKVIAGAKFAMPLTATSTSTPRISIITPALRFGLRRDL
ncbi:hypothetical protein N9595_01875 [Bacteroidia bacterium]|nr:hypothetical protein [Bacteroidia bacterium]